MSEEEKVPGEVSSALAGENVPSEQPYLDEHTTEPNTSKPDQQAAAPAPAKWQMPKPTFQQTSGYLPQGYLKNVEQATTVENASADSETEVQEQETPSQPPQGPQQIPPPDIEPQPELDDDLLVNDPVVENNVVQTSAKSGSTFPVVALGLIGILIFIAIFLAAVYFLFFAAPSGNNNF